MKRALALALGIPAIALTFVWAGCALVIDLGDDVSLRVPVVDSGPSDAGIEAAVSDGAPACGLKQTQNEACATCFDDHCCPEGRACADDPACKLGLECLQYCMGQFLGCIDACLAEARGDATAGPLDRLAACSQTGCNKQCTPNADCIKYGACALKIVVDAGEVLRNNSRDIVLQNDGPECIKQRQILIDQFDASCP